MSVALPIHAQAPQAFATGRLALAPLTLADVADIAALHADPRVARYLLDGVPQTPAQARAFIAWSQRFYADGHGTWAARRLDSGAFVGLFSLVPFEGLDELELGGKLAPAAWGRGLALEAGAALIDHAFGRLAQATLVSAYHPHNRPVAAILAELGFTHVGEASVFGRPARLARLTRAAWDAQGGAPLPRRKGRAL